MIMIWLYCRGKEIPQTGWTRSRGSPLRLAAAMEVVTGLYFALLNNMTDEKDSRLPREEREEPLSSNGILLTGSR